MSPQSKDGSYFMNPAMANAHDQQGPVAQGDGDPGADGAGKVSAADAGYEDTADSCSTCDHFQGDGQPCAVVSDPVQSAGWCKLFAGGGGGSEDDKGQLQPSAPDQGGPLLGAPGSGSAR